MIRINGLNRVYRSKKRSAYHALHNIDLCLPDAGLVFLLGKSGSGKSTLLNLIGGLDSATGGRIQVDGNDLSALRQGELSDYRNTHVGFVFQDYYLIDELTVYENVALSLELRHRSDDERVRAALEKVELSGYEDRYPAELSGGERQRVAIARAIVKAPRIILADEPTGNLDANTARSILELLKSVSRQALVFVVSHNGKDADTYADRIIELSAGRIVSDRTRNPNFTDRVVLEEDCLVYPEGQPLSDEDIAVINGSMADGSRIVKRTDKYIPTEPRDEDGKRLCMERARIRLGRTVKLGSKFLKNKLVAIGLYAFMVTAIMVIMALAQTITAFDARQVIKKEMEATGMDSVYLTKTLTDAQKDHISQLNLVTDCFPEIHREDIRKFTDAGYDGRIYPVLKYNLNLSQSNVSAGMATVLFEKSPYILEPLGTMVVDEAFLEEKFGQVKYLAQAQQLHPTGVVITDYIADIILLSGQVTYAKDYESLLGEYHWGVKDSHSCVSRGYINGIIYTGYKDKYADVLREIESQDMEALFEDKEFLGLVEDIHGSYGFCYSLNENFSADALTDPAWQMLWHYCLQFDDRELFTADIPQVRRGSFYGIALGENEVLMDLNSYNQVFKTAYTASTADSFTPHTVRLSHYKYYDSGDALFTKQIKIVGLFASGQDDLCGTLIAGDGVYDAFAKDHIFTTGLYFDGGENLACVLETASTLGYQKNMAVIESIQTMTKVVEIFVPIFRLIAIVLCVAVVFILMNFASRMINGKLYDIGIMKAIGGKNATVGVVFGMQVVLIALLTGLLSTVGYWVLVDATNDLLVDSLKTIASNRVILDLEFLSFDLSVVLQNWLLIMLLALISFVAPMIRICTFDPVKIIRTKD